MSIVKAIIATTHVDSQREMLTKEALEDMVSQAKRKYVKVTNEHDPRQPPIGRTIDARLVELADGNFGVESTFELFDGKNPLQDDPNKSLEVLVPDDDRLLTINYDFSYRQHDSLKKLEELNKKLQFHSNLHYYGKKAAEPVSILALSGVYLLGKIFEGFLHKVGEETFSVLKHELFEALALQKDKPERILEFDLVLKNGDNSHSIHIYLTNPTEEQIGLVLDKGLKRLDQTIGGYLSPQVKEVAINLSGTKFEVTYLLNGKARPLIPKEEFRMIDIEI